jgi:hypothetical protein
MHFTGVSNITATFNFQLNAGATPAFTGENGSLLTPVFGGTISENPTISIVPVEPSAVSHPRVPNGCIPTGSRQSILAS